VARRQQDATLPTPVSRATTARLPLPLTQLLSFVAIIARNDELDIEFFSDKEETLSRDGYDGGVDFGDSRRFLRVTSTRYARNRLRPFLLSFRIV
jgi:hypothetical protein